MTKKTIMSCLLVVLFLAVLTSCFDASVGTISSETKNDTTEMETGPALVKTELDAEALVSVRAIADEALKNQYGITDFSDIQVRGYEYIDFEGVAYTWLFYDVFLYGIPTDVSYFVELKNGKVEVDKSGHIPDWVLKSVTEEAMRDAVARMDVKTEWCRVVATLEYDTGYSLRMMNHDTLILWVEYIVNWYPSGTSSDPDGVIEGGCGIDHEHYTFAEVVELSE